MTYNELTKKLKESGIRTSALSIFNFKETRDKFANRVKNENRKIMLTLDIEVLGFYVATLSGKEYSKMRNIGF